MNFEEISKSDLTACPTCGNHVVVCKSVTGVSYYIPVSDAIAESVMEDISAQHKEQSPT